MPAEQCPTCGATRAGRICLLCGHDYSAAAATSARVRWTAHVTADRAYFSSVRSADDPDTPPAEFPADSPERTFVLSGQQVRIGRRTAHGVPPEIDLGAPPADPGVSHLHAVLLAQPDGGWTLVDPGSTNGTWLNDADEPVRVNAAIALQPGDRIHLGAWTSIAFTIAELP
jgi:pSer/pThr/pTyr-binding forkhead associated (FHA) protein